VIDGYDLAPDDAQDKRWNLAAARAYGAFANRRARQLQMQCVEIDCADLAIKLLEDFCKDAGLPSPLAERGKWSVYSTDNTGGLPNVKGPNWLRSELHADNLAKELTVPVNDANGNGTAGKADEQGAVDVGDLRPGEHPFHEERLRGRSQRPPARSRNREPGGGCGALQAQPGRPARLAGGGRGRLAHLQPPRVRPVEGDLRTERRAVGMAERAGGR
jgi:hypothetical protein